MGNLDTLVLQNVYSAKSEIELKIFRRNIWGEHSGESLVRLSDIKGGRFDEEYWNKNLADMVRKGVKPAGSKYDDVEIYKLHLMVSD